MDKIKTKKPAKTCVVCKSRKVRYTLVAQGGRTRYCRACKRNVDEEIGRELLS